MVEHTVVQKSVGGYVEYVYRKQHVQISVLVSSVHDFRSSRYSSKTFRTPPPQLPSDVDIRLSTCRHNVQRRSIDIDNLRCEVHVVYGTNNKSCGMSGSFSLGRCTVVSASVDTVEEYERE